jgi:hypothetical protein
MAKAVHAHNETQQAQLAMLTAKQEVVEEGYEAAVSAPIDRAADVDGLGAQLRDALTAYRAQSKVVQDAYRRAVNFNSELSPSHNHNEILKPKHQSTWPKAIRPQYFGVPTPEFELFQDVGRGTISHHRQPIQSLARSLRQAFNKVMPVA